MTAPMIPPAVDPTPWYQSKTLWLGAIAAVLGVLDFLQTLPLPPGALTVVGGFALDFFSFTTGAISLSLLGAVLVVNYLFIHFFTNRSFWTLILLGGIGTVITFTLHALFTRSFFAFFTIIII